MYTFDQAIQSLLTSLQPTVNVGTLPVIIMRNVVLVEAGKTCPPSCVLGYHSGFFFAGRSNEQVYIVADIDTPEIFRVPVPYVCGGDVTALSSVLSAAINDPMGNNPTPSWGNVGSAVGVCQSNLEVGDPLSPVYDPQTQ